MDKFAELQSKISIDYDCTVISSNFNIHIDNPSNPDTNSFLNLIETFELSPHVMGPAHQQGHGFESL